MGGGGTINSIRVIGLNQTIPGRLANSHSTKMRPGKGITSSVRDPVLFYDTFVSLPKSFPGARGRALKVKEAACARAWSVNMLRTGGCSRPAFTRW